MNEPERAVQSLITQISQTAPGQERARLFAELALLQLQTEASPEAAESAARQALAENETLASALFALGVVTHSQGRYPEALEYLSRLGRAHDSLPLSQTLDAAARQIDAATRLGLGDAALEPAQRLLALAPEDPVVLRQIADVLFNAGRHADAAPLLERLNRDFGKSLSSEARLQNLVQWAAACRALGEKDKAVALYEEALELDSNSAESLTAIAEIFSEQENWQEVWDAKRRLLALSDGETRADIFVQLGELAATKLGDRTRAASSFVDALEMRPADRNILSRLMQIYTEERDWANTLEVVLKLADFVDEEPQKARYLVTAGMINLREMNDTDAALDCYERALQLDPMLDKALDESTKLLVERGDFGAIETLIKRKMRAATALRDTPKTLDAFLRLGNLYHLHTNQVDAGVEVYEAALTLDPQNTAAKDALFELYLKDAPKYFTKARALQQQLLEADPYRPEPYKSLRRLYTELKSPDGAWCLCQALCVLKMAEPDEERFYKRMRSDDPAYAQAVLSDEDYRRVLHPVELDPLLSELFACIEPAVIANRGYEFFQLGYDPNLAVDLARHPYPIGQTLHYAAGVMGMAPPPCFDNTNDPGGLAFLDTKIPAISMGLGVLTGEIHPQAIAFLTGRHLTYYRPGFFLRQLVGTGTGLKAWLFAAIKLVSPQFPVTPDIAGAVADNATALAATFAPHSRDTLARLVSKLVQGSGALDLKRWVAAVDQTADRVGFVLAHDLETSLEVLRRSAEPDGNTEQRIRDLVQFSVSPGYLELRQRLQVHLSI
jgi:tetratricopeptide (TPR) repeat protein